MIYRRKPRTTYPGRGVVRAIEAMLIMAIVVVVAGALMDRLSPNDRMAHRSSNVPLMIPNMAPPAGVVARADAIDFFNAGLAYKYNGDYEAAIQSYTRALEMDPSLIVSYLNRGVMHEISGDPWRARQDFWDFVSRNSYQTIVLDDAPIGETFEVQMIEGRMIQIPIYLEPGQTISVQVESVVPDQTDPLTLLLDSQQRPVQANDDIRIDGRLDSWNSSMRYMASFDGSCAGKGNVGFYTLVISHAGGGSNGPMNVTIDLS